MEKQLCKLNCSYGNVSHALNVYVSKFSTRYLICCGSFAVQKNVGKVGMDVLYAPKYKCYFQMLRVPESWRLTPSRSFSLIDLRESNISVRIYPNFDEDIKIRFENARIYKLVTSTFQSSQEEVNEGMLRLKKVTPSEFLLNRVLSISANALIAGNIMKSISTRGFVHV